MNETLSDIRARLLNGEYSNEEHVRLSLVARILQRLDWDIWNPKEVNSEFIVVPNEDKTRVDLALFLRAGIPSVFIEIKAVGQMQPRLQEVERQVRDYNRNNTALFSIITDGGQWRFYYSQTAGEFSQKVFESFDIRIDNLEDVGRSMLTFLKKSEVANENARREAESYLRLGQKQRAMEDCLSESRRLVNEAPFPSLPEALVKLVKEEGFSVTAEEAMKFIKDAAERKPAIAVVAPPVGSPVPERRPQCTKGKRRELNPEDPDSLFHTSIIEGQFSGESVSTWNGLVHCAFRKAHQNGIPFTTLRGLANLAERDPRHPSFKKVEGTPFWIQGMDANQAWKRSLKLAKHIRCSIQVVFVWRNKDEATHPGDEAEVQWSPAR